MFGQSRHTDTHTRKEDRLSCHLWVWLLAWLSVARFSGTALETPKERRGEETIERKKMEALLKPLRFDHFRSKTLLTIQIV